MEVTVAKIQYCTIEIKQSIFDEVDIAGNSYGPS